MNYYYNYNIIINIKKELTLNVLKLRRSTILGEEEENNDHHPTILGTEEKDIPEQRPPNDKIIYFQLNHEENKS